MLHYCTIIANNNQTSREHANEEGDSKTPWSKYYSHNDQTFETLRLKQATLLSCLNITPSYFDTGTSATTIRTSYGVLVCELHKVGRLGPSHILNHT
jgi:hypothetical protein